MCTISTMRHLQISVVIPAYNEERFLPHLLRSLQRQTFNLPYEIIVVNNNSTDSTAKVAKKYGARVVFEKRRGYAFACNKGFYAAKGKIIARADADYVVPSNWLQKIWNEFRKDHTLIALGGPTYPLDSTWWESYLFYPVILFWMYVLKFMGEGFLYPNMAVRRNDFLRCGGFNTNITFGEDLDICKKLKRIGRVKLFPHIYIYTSLRRLRATGLYNMITKYTLANLFAIKTGKKATFGTEPIRIVPKSVPKLRNPFPYLIAMPTTLALISLGTITAMNSQPSQMLSEKAYIQFQKFFAQKINAAKFFSEETINIKKW